MSVDEFEILDGQGRRLSIGVLPYKNLMDFGSVEQMLQLSFSRAIIAHLSYRLVTGE